MKWVAVAMCMIELVERASYYGTQGCFANFVNYPLPAGGSGTGAVARGPGHENDKAGALGMGSKVATATGQTFTFLAYVIPVFGGIVSDTKWGRFKTICVGTGVGVVAHFLLIIPAAPVVIRGGSAIAPFVIFMILLAFAAGFIKPSIAPLLCDQSPVKRPTLKTLKSGERVIVDPQATVQRYLLVFYWCINVGGFFSVATSYAERFVGFWLAFLLPGLIYALTPPILWFAHKRMYQAPPQGSVVLETYHVFKQLFKRGGFFRMFVGGQSWWDSAKPSHIAEVEGGIDPTVIFWDDKFVDEIHQSFQACGIFLLIPVFNLADNGIGNSLNSMTGGMTLNSIPNDIMNNFNPLAIIVATPIITYGFYPLCDRLRIPMKPMTRISIGFVLGAISCIFAAVIQKRIYDTSPCGNQASTCVDADGKSLPSPVNLAWQIPMYVIPAIGEIFVNVTSYEIAYTRAPARMKGLVYSLCLFSTAISSAIGLALSDVIVDPKLVIPWYVLIGACIVCAALFPTYFRYMNEPLRTFNDLDRMEGLTTANETSGVETKTPAQMRAEKEAEKAAKGGGVFKRALGKSHKSEA